MRTNIRVSIQLFQGLSITTKRTWNSLLLLLLIPRWASFWLSPSNGTYLGVSKWWALHIISFASGLVDEKIRCQNKVVTLWTESMRLLSLLRLHFLFIMIYFNLLFGSFYFPIKFKLYFLILSVWCIIIKWKWIIKLK